MTKESNYDINSDYPYFNVQLHPVIYPLLRQKDFGSSDFFGSLGGLMGLFAGISIISIIEVVLKILSVAFERIVRRININKIHVIKASPMPAPKTISVNREHVLYQCSVLFFKYFKRSDIHGLHYITDKNNHLAWRIFWGITVLTSIIFCLILIFDVTKHAELNPIELRVDDRIWNLEDVSFLDKLIFSKFMLIFQIPFPSITLCLDMNMEKYNESRGCIFPNSCEHLADELKEKLKKKLISRIMCLVRNYFLAIPDLK